MDTVPLKARAMPTVLPKSMVTNPNRIMRPSRMDMYNLEATAAWLLPRLLIIITSDELAEAVNSILYVVKNTYLFC